MRSCRCGNYEWVIDALNHNRRFMKMEAEKRFRRKKRVTHTVLKGRVAELAVVTGHRGRAQVSLRVYINQTGIAPGCPDPAAFVYSLLTGFKAITFR